ncbi:MAG: thiamine diphosphokinase [Rhizobacter sp.]|nr:thiamine diphosphokinase [Chlorobiales bacterium]
MKTFTRLLLFMSNHFFLIIADGTPISAERLHTLAEGRKLIALDGAANYLRSLNLTPEFILGDMDSITPETKSHFTSQRVAFIHTPRQDATDLEKAILYCRENNAASIHIVSALGRRTDHTLGNLSFLKKYHTPASPLHCFTETEEIIFVQDARAIIGGETGSRVAVLGFMKCTVKSTGLVYEMNGLPLELGASESLSNALASPHAAIEVAGDALIISEARSLALTQKL